jgi:hypothetical protein
MAQMAAPSMGSGGEGELHLPEVDRFGFGDWKAVCG